MLNIDPVLRFIEAVVKIKTSVKTIYEGLKTFIL